MRPACCGRHTVPRLPVIRQPSEPERRSRPGLQHHCWQLKFARCFTRPTSVLGMPPPPSSSGRYRSPPGASGGEAFVNSMSAGAGGQHDVSIGLLVSWRPLKPGAEAVGDAPGSSPTASVPGLEERWTKLDEIGHFLRRAELSTICFDSGCRGGIYDACHVGFAL